MSMLEELLLRMRDHWTYEDIIYRFYHQSFKVFGLQGHTLEIVALLQSLTPGHHLNKLFMCIVSDGTGKTFTLDDNQHWRQTTAPIVEAFFHAMYFLEMAVKYGKLIESAEGSLPSGWAGLLYLYDLR